MKDDTDLMLAIRLGFERGYKVYFIYGGSGGRLDIQ
jgi:thiamine pyrophosphokinase